LGLRSFSEYGNVTGRAWVQPLNADLLPTHDAEHAHAYLVFNGYGELDGYQSARIVAHLSSKSYRKISFSTRAMYVNNDAAYLIADEATCAATSHVSIDAGCDGDCHDYTFDAATFHHYHAGV